MFSALIDSVSERVAERICSRIEERLQQSQRSTQSSSLSLSTDDPDQLITKAEACHLLDRHELFHSVHSVFHRITSWVLISIYWYLLNGAAVGKWAERGILMPIRRGGQLYYRKSDVIKMYNGEL